MATEPKSQPSFSPGRRWKIGFDVVVRTALVLAVVVMVNYLGAQFFRRFYLSSQTRVKLSSRTLSVLHSITNHVTVTLYYDTDQDDFYPTIVALLNEYQAANPEHFRPDGGLRARCGRGGKGQGAIQAQCADGQEPRHFRLRAAG